MNHILLHHRLPFPALTRLLLPALLLIIAMALPAAVRAQATVKFGVKGGGNYSQVVGDDVDEDIVSSKLGLHGGIFVNYRSSSGVLSLQPELQYTGKGFEYEREVFGTLGSTRTESQVRLHYLELPLLLKGHIGGFFLEAGPQASLLLSAPITTRTTNTVAGVSETDRNRSKNKRGLYDFDFGLAAGLGYEFESGFLFGLRYNAGLRHIVRNTANASPLIPANARNSVLMLTVGMYFPEQ